MSVSGPLRQRKLLAAPRLVSTKAHSTLDAWGIGNARVEWGLQHVSGIQLTVGDTIENSLQRLPSSLLDFSSTYATATKGNDRRSPTQTHQQARRAKLPPPSPIITHPTQVPRRPQRRDNQTTNNNQFVVRRHRTDTT